MKLVYIEWEDATGSHHWHTQPDLDEWIEEASTLIKQVGWVYKETKQFIILVSRTGVHVYDPDGHGADELAYGLCQRIPQTWIRRRIDLTPHLKPKKRKHAKKLH